MRINVTYSDTVSEMINIYHEMRAVTNKACINLRKWESNSEEFDVIVPLEDRGIS